MWLFAQISLLVLVVVSAVKENTLRLEWCDLYGTVDVPKTNKTTLLFHKLTTQFEKDLYKDLSCLLKPDTFVVLSPNKSQDQEGKLIVTENHGSPCESIVEYIKVRRSAQVSRFAAILQSSSECDIEQTSVVLKDLKTSERLSFWKIVPCTNCTYTTAARTTFNGHPILIVSLPTLFSFRLIPHMESVHMLANELMGLPVAPDTVKGLYVNIAEHTTSVVDFKRFTNWEKGSHIAALVTLIFMFFVVAMFVCCCALTQSALIIEDYNHRDEMHLMWRLQENDQPNAPPPQASSGDVDNLSIRSEATQGSAELGESVGCNST
ncbi:hypothetical protein Q1695_004581 [Nippostrongylus brasiliensis]|nr:hypothetical protein Q1695_004581 [Nippostrongylus brasiliensis]